MSGVSNVPFRAYGIGSEVLETHGESVTLIDVAPIAPGHLLVVTKGHVSAMANAEPQHWTNVLLAAEKARTRLSRIYGRPVWMFEHGVSEMGGEHSCRIVHAHLHVVPTEVDLAGALSAAFQVDSYFSPTEALRLVPPRRDYLLVADGSDRCLLALDPGARASQFFRRAVGQHTRMPGTWMDTHLLHFEECRVRSLELKNSFLMGKHELVHLEIANSDDAAEFSFNESRRFIGR